MTRASTHSRVSVLVLALGAGLPALPCTSYAQQAQRTQFDAASDSLQAGPLKLARRLIADEGKVLISGVGDALKAPARWDGRELTFIPLVFGGLAALSLADNEGRDFM